MTLWLAARKWLPRITLAGSLLLVAYLSAKASTVYVRTKAMSTSVGSTVYLPIAINGSSYYLSPSGNDSQSGTSPAEAWATFNHAWSELRPGDTLTLMDGVYYQPIHPQRVGAVGNPVTIRAENDGQAIIDGQGVRVPVDIEAYRSSYLVIEGIVARNSSSSVFTITGDHNVLRRVSGYDANTDENAHVFTIAGDYNLLEDCVAAGTGRKMILVFGGEHNTIRRCFADWRSWDGRNWCNSEWPWGEGIEIYTASNNIIENSIAYGNTSRAGISLLAQGWRPSNSNKILGSMAILSGMKHDGTPMLWGPDPNSPPLTQLQPLVRPGPTNCSALQNLETWPSLLSGIRVGGSGQLHDNLLQDVLAWGSARYGLTFHRAGSSPSFINNRVIRATVFNNGLNNTEKKGGDGVDAWQDELVRFDAIEDSYIGKLWTGSTYITMNGEGARLTNRYVDGVLTNEPLWPWPMEGRIQAELGISVTDIMTSIISSAP